MQPTEQPKPTENRLSAETAKTSQERQPGGRNAPAESTTYGQILKSSSIIGGAQGINYVIGMVRTKLVAVLLGPSGVGLVGLYVSATGLVGTIAGLGLDSSGVREVAEAHGSGDPQRIARTAKTLRRVCWLTGLLGWILSAVFSYPLSVWTFGTPERAWAIALLGGTVFFSAVAGGRTALIQGTRRIGDLARLNVLGAVAGTVVAVGLYWWLGERGIVPVLLATAAINLGGAWWFARRIQTVRITQTWTETLANSKQLIHLGLAFMYGAVLAALVGLAIRALIVRQLGLDANGIYQAAWALSGLFAGFILNAMGMDFYPRLTAVAQDNAQVNRLVNEQIEIGILLALPGILGTLAFAPWLMHLLYTSKFLPGADLLPWLAIGVFAQVMTFPLGFIQRAKGRGGWIIASQTHLNLLHVLLCLALVPRFGVVAAAWAFALAAYWHGLAVWAIARRLSAFRWGQTCVLLAASASAIVGLALALQQFMTGWLRLATGMSITVGGLLFSLRGITARLGAEHRLVKMALKLPGGRLACGL